jgi:hypothetical protein
MLLKAHFFHYIDIAKIFFAFCLQGGLFVAIYSESTISMQSIYLENS